MSTIPMTTAEKALHGETRGERMRVGLDGREIGSAEPPAEFSPEEKEYWYKIFDVFNEVDCLSSLDLPALNLLVKAYTRCMVLGSALRDNGSPVVAVSDMKATMAMLANFGGTPAFRGHVKPIKKKAQSELDRLRDEMNQRTLEMK